MAVLAVGMTGVDYEADRRRNGAWLMAKYQLEDVHRDIGHHTDHHSMVSSAGDRYLDANGCPDLLAIPSEEIGPLFEEAFAVRKLPGSAVPADA